MAIIKLAKKPKKEQKSHSFLRQHHWNFVPSEGAAAGMQCRWTDKSLTGYLVLRTLKNLRMAFERLEIVVRYNDFTRTVEVKGNIEPESEGALDDAILGVIAGKLEETYGLKISLGDLSTKLNFIARHNRYDPFENYFYSLNWDSVERVETIWIDYANADDTALNRAYGRLFAISMVARCFLPGIKVDEVIEPPLVCRRPRSKDTGLWKRRTLERGIQTNCVHVLCAWSWITRANIEAGQPRFHQLRRRLDAAGTACASG